MASQPIELTEVPPSKIQHEEYGDKVLQEVPLDQANEDPHGEANEGQYPHGWRLFFFLLG